MSSGWATIATAFRQSSGRGLKVGCSLMGSPRDVGAPAGSLAHMALLDQPLRTARNAVFVSFATGGVAMATWVSRLPDVADRLDLDDATLGVLLLCASVGALLTMSRSGRMIQTFGPGRVVAGGTIADVVGILLIGLGAGPLESVALTGAGLAVFGAGYGVWDVAMNVEAA